MGCDQLHEGVVVSKQCGTVGGGSRGSDVASEDENLLRALQMGAFDVL